MGPRGEVSGEVRGHALQDEDTMVGRPVGLQAVLSLRHGQQGRRFQLPPGQVFTWPQESLVLGGQRAGPESSCPGLTLGDLGDKKRGVCGPSLTGGG